MLENVHLRVPGDRRPERVDRFLRDAFPDLPARSVRFAIEAGDVLVAGRPRRKGELVAAGEDVAVRRIAEAADWLPCPGPLAGAAILYADPEIVIFDKPANVHTEPHRPNEKGTLAGHLLFLYPDVLAVSRAPGLTLLTRLDYVTSGAVPAARTAAAFRALKKERELGRIEKTYVCVVEGRIEEERTLRFRLDSEGGERVRVLTDREDPDPRRWTRIIPLRSTPWGTVLQASISKGKRHQIRAHLAAAGFPVVGDRKYGTVPASGPGKDRLMLHAVRVTFRHPSTGGVLTVASPLPEGF